MKLQLILGSLVLASTAYAQAPGETELAPPGMAPALVPAAPPPPPMRRWSIGLGIGSLDLAPHAAPENTTEFSIGQLAVRYRATRRLEFELSTAGGQEDLEHGMKGTREVGYTVLAARFRFAPERRWNWWVLAGMGALSITTPEQDEASHEAAMKSTLQFGIGLERRWTRFALQLEARAVGVKRDEGDEVAPVAPGYYMEPATTTLSSDGWKGGLLSLSGNYYF